MKSLPCIDNSYEPGEGYRPLGRTIMSALEQTAKGREVLRALNTGNQPVSRSARDKGEKRLRSTVDK